MYTDNLQACTRGILLLYPLLGTGYLDTATCIPRTRLPVSTWKICCSSYVQHKTTRLHHQNVLVPHYLSVLCFASFTSTAPPAATSVFSSCLVVPYCCMQCAVVRTSIMCQLLPVRCSFCSLPKQPQRYHTAVFTCTPSNQHSSVTHATTTMIA